MSVIMREAFDRWKEMRDDFELYRHAAYERACADLGSELLNERGKDCGVDPYSLFLGPTARAVAYASEDLLRWWTEDGQHRMTVEEFERQWLAQRGEEDESGPQWAAWTRGDENDG